MHSARSTSRRSLLSERIIGLVTDEWQDMEEFMDRAIPLVPPGRALRAWQMQRDKVDADYAARVAAGKRVIARKPYPSQHEQHRQGARSMVNAILGDARERKWVDIEVGESRRDRRIRRSYERRYADHCCLHGGSCAGTAERTGPPAVPAEDDPNLMALVERVLASRTERLAANMVDCPDCGRPCRGQTALVTHRQSHQVREVVPGEIDRLLRECG